MSVTLAYLSILIVVFIHTGIWNFFELMYHQEKIEINLIVKTEQNYF